MKDVGRLSSSRSDSFAGVSYSFGFGGFEEFVEQRAEVDHGKAQVFGGGLALGVAKHDYACGAVVLDGRRVVYGYVGSSLLGLADGVSPGGQNGVDERVGLADGVGRIVDEAALDGRPVFGISLTVRGGEWSEGKLLDSLLAFEEDADGIGGQ